MWTTLCKCSYSAQFSAPNRTLLQERKRQQSLWSWVAYLLVSNRPQPTFVKSVKIYLTFFRAIRQIRTRYIGDCRPVIGSILSPSLRHGRCPLTPYEIAVLVSRNYYSCLLS